MEPLACLLGLPVCRLTGMDFAQLSQVSGQYVSWWGALTAVSAIASLMTVASGAPLRRIALLESPTGLIIRRLLIAFAALVIVATALPLVTAYAKWAPVPLLSYPAFYELLALLSATIASALFIMTIWRPELAFRVTSASGIRALANSLWRAQERGDSTNIQSLCGLLTGYNTELLLQNLLKSSQRKRAATKRLLSSLGSSDLIRNALTRHQPEFICGAVTFMLEHPDEYSVDSRLLERQIEDDHSVVARYFDTYYLDESGQSGAELTERLFTEQYVVDNYEVFGRDYYRSSPLALNRRSKALLMTLDEYFASPEWHTDAISHKLVNVIFDLRMETERAWKDRSGRNCKLDAVEGDERARLGSLHHHIFDVLSRAKCADTSREARVEKSLTLLLQDFIRLVQSHGDSWYGNLVERIDREKLPASPAWTSVVSGLLPLMPARV